MQLYQGGLFISGEFIRKRHGFLQAHNDYPFLPHYLTRSAKLNAPQRRPCAGGESLNPAPLMPAAAPARADERM
jgi:hypothetical protein